MVRGVRGFSDEDGTCAAGELRERISGRARTRNQKAVAYHVRANYHASRDTAETSLSGSSDSQFRARHSRVSRRPLAPRVSAARTTAATPRGWRGKSGAGPRARRRPCRAHGIAGSTGPRATVPQPTRGRVGSLRGKPPRPRPSPRPGSRPWPIQGDNPSAKG